MVIAAETHCRMANTIMLTICEFEDNNYKSAIFVDSGFLVDVALEMLAGGELSVCLTNEMV